MRARLRSHANLVVGRKESTGMHRWNNVLGNMTRATQSFVTVFTACVVFGSPVAADEVPGPVGDVQRNVSHRTELTEALLQSSQTFGPPGDYADYGFFFGGNMEQTVRILVAAKEERGVWLELVFEGGRMAIKVLIKPGKEESTIVARWLRYGTEVFLLPEDPDKPKAKKVP